MRKPAILRLAIISVIVLSFFLFPVLGSASKTAGIKAIDPVHGPAKIKGEEVSYYYFKTKLSAEAETTVIFKQGTCLLSDQKGNNSSNCWIHVAGGSAGLSVTQQAPVNMKTVALELEDNRPSNFVRWNTSMVSGPQGALEFKIPKGGFVVLNFLWEIPKGFSPGRIKIGDIVEVSIKK